MSEEVLQVHIVKLLNAYARSDIEWHHVPNGFDRHPAVARKVKEAGGKSGVADLMFLIDGKSFAVELKTEIGVVSKEQLDWREEFERAGGVYFVAFGLDESIGVIQGINAFKPNIKISVPPASDASGVRRRPWQEKSTRAAARANPSPVKPRRAADPVSPNI